MGACDQRHTIKPSDKSRPASPSPGREKDAVWTCPGRGFQTKSSATIHCKYNNYNRKSDAPAAKLLLPPHPPKTPSPRPPSDPHRRRHPHPRPAHLHAADRGDVHDAAGPVHFVEPGDDAAGAEAAQREADAVPVAELLG